MGPLSYEDSHIHLEHSRRSCHQHRWGILVKCGGEGGSGNRSKMASGDSSFGVVGDSLRASESGNGSLGGGKVC